MWPTAPTARAEQTSEERIGPGTVSPVRIPPVRMPPPPPKITGSMAGDRQFLLDLIEENPTLTAYTGWSTLTAETDLWSLRTGDGNKTAFGGGTPGDPGLRINPEGRVTHINLNKVQGVGRKKLPGSIRRLTELEHLHFSMEESTKAR
jgi:hypothetical protein